MSLTGPTVPPEVYSRLMDEIDEQRLEYADNFRFALADDNVAVQLYELRQETGCCGRYDDTVLDDQGRLWMFGCNYGH